MKTRIARTIVGVTALIIVALGVPLAVVTQRFYDGRATIELQRSAAEAVAELTIPLDADAIAEAATEPDAPAEFSVDDSSGTRLYGSGPDRLDITDPDELVITSPITDRTTETVVGTVRVSRPRSDIAAQARRAWAVMAAAALAGILLSVLLARREAARLAAPIAELATRAEQLGSGNDTQPIPPTGTPELDTLAAALEMSSRRLDELITREREFSANASHQLRTPLAGLRVALERGDLDAASSAAARLSETIDHMLALARNSLPSAAPIHVTALLDAAATRWQPHFDAADRSLVSTIATSLPAVHVRRGSLEQALDILLDNSLRHGNGDTRLLARTTAGGIVIQIDDDGPGIANERTMLIFDRHEGDSNGIGLALARTLVEAEGGKLLLTDPDHAEFRIIFATANPRTTPVAARADGPTSTTRATRE